MFKGCDNYGANYFGQTGQAQSLVSQVSPVPSLPTLPYFLLCGRQRNHQKHLLALLAMSFYAEKKNNVRIYYHNWVRGCLCIC